MPGPRGAELRARVLGRYAPGALYVLWRSRARVSPAERFAASVALRWERAALSFESSLTPLRSRVAEDVPPEAEAATPRFKRGQVPVAPDDVAHRTHGVAEALVVMKEKGANFLIVARRNDDDEIGIVTTRDIAKHVLAPHRVGGVAVRLAQRRVVPTAHGVEVVADGAPRLPLEAAQHR